MKKKWITCHGDVETTSFFMTQIEKQLAKDGYEVCPLFFRAPKQEGGYTPEELEQMLTMQPRAGKRGQTSRQPETYEREQTRDSWIFLTFNFAGIYGEDTWRLSDGSEAALTFDFFCVNIMVDHPYHYHDFLNRQMQVRPHRFLQFCIDKFHVTYMKRYFQDVMLGGFLPSAGTDLWQAGKTEMTDGTDKADQIDMKGRAERADRAHMTDGTDKADRTDRTETQWKERGMDIVFTGTYIRPEHFDVFIDRNGEEYSLFYHSVMEEVLSDPNALLEDVMRRRLTEEIPEATEEEIKETLGHMQFLDYYVRFRRREKVIAALADAGLTIHIFGSGWEELPCRHPENLIRSDYIDSKSCLEKLANAKFSLNIMPCFHAGAHDRIFNSMLCGAVCVTDTNPYLDEMLTDGENALLYDVTEPERLAERLKHLLSEKDAYKIARNGYAFAAASHTWACRTKQLEKQLEKQLDSITF